MAIPFDRYCHEMDKKTHEMIQPGTYSRSIYLLKTDPFYVFMRIISGVGLLQRIYGTKLLQK